ncbi:MAG TPA: hypothetical protein VG406_18745 [Isosphaeraceae bacterium]|jgi:hypothetical protein|nr:hypothetical protein [Isosphaeraceae bacterium]
MATEAQIAANQRNAKLARGPKTIEGKQIARGNALKHGLSGAGVVLLPEDRETYERRRAEWAEGLGVESGERQYHLDRAVMASVRLDRCVTIESARLADRASEAERLFDRHERRKARALGKRLADDPVKIGVRLRGTAVGCRWLVDRLDALAARLAGPGTLDDPFWADCHHILGASSTWPRDIIDDPEARQSLVDAIAAERTALAAERDRLEVEVEAPARQHARTLALFDPSDEAMRLAKYESLHESTLHRSLKAVDRGSRAKRLPEAEIEPEIAPALVENEPNSAPVAAQNEPNSAPVVGLRVVPRPSPRPIRNEPKRLVRWFAAWLLLGMLAGLFLRPSGAGDDRPNSLLGRVFGPFVGAVERPQPAATGAAASGSRPAVAKPSDAGKPTPVAVSSAFLTGSVARESEE